MAPGFLAGFGPGIYNVQQNQLNQQYVQALRDLAMQQQRQQLNWAIQDRARQQQQNALGFALARRLGQGGPDTQGLINPNPFGQQPDLQQMQQPLPAVPSYGQGGGMPQMAGGTGLPALRQQVLSLEGNQDYGVGKAGELGPGQIKPETGAQYGYQPQQLYGDSGRAASGRIVDDLYKKSGGDTAATLVGYNAGPGAMRRFQAAGDDPNAVKLAPSYASAVKRELNLSPEQHEQANDVATSAAAALPPQMAGQLDTIRLARLVDEIAGPDVPDDVKFGAMTSLHKLLAPDAQQQFKMTLEAYKAFSSEGDKAKTRKIAEDRLSEERRHHRTIEGQGEERLDRGTAGGGQKLEASKMFDVLDDKGKVVRTVMARERRDQAGFLDSQTGQPIELKPGERLRQVTPTTSGGGRAGAQVLRQQVGGREVLSDLQNAVNLPVGTTIGPLGTVSQGTSIGAALKGDLVRKLTDQDSQLMQASMASMSRELSILMSPVYGGNWAAQQIDPLIPKSGDTLGTVLFKLSRLAQSADNALEAISKSPILSNEQQDYAQDLRKQIGEAIPWSSQQAMAFAREGQGGESFGDFVKRQGISGGHKAGDIIERGGKRWKVIGGDPNDPDVEPAQ